MKRPRAIILAVLGLGSVAQAVGQCYNYHELVKLNNCGVTLSSTTDPIVDHAMRWFPNITGGDPVAYYNIKLDSSQPVPMDGSATGWTFNQAVNLFAWATTYWSSQCVGAPTLVWTPTSIGGEIRWTKDNDIGPRSYGATFHALNVASRGQIVAWTAAACGNNQRGQTEIVLNNSADFYRSHPNESWTTDYSNTQPGPGVALIDFQSIILHELGHFVGLYHDGDNLAVMASGYRGRVVTLQACDYARFRRLYCSDDLELDPGSPPTVTVQIELERDTLRLVQRSARTFELLGTRDYEPFSSLQLFNITGKSLDAPFRIIKESDASVVRFSLTGSIPAGHYIIVVQVGNRAEGARVYVY
jgi:hypothetical protein